MYAEASDAARRLVAFAMFVALCACAHAPADSQARLALYLEHLGRPVASIEYVRNMRWEALGDQALAVWPRRDAGFLLEMASPCTGLDTARSIQITHAERRVRSRLDAVRILSMPGSRPMQRPPCPILLISPINDVAHGKLRDVAQDEDE